MKTTNLMNSAINVCIALVIISMLSACATKKHSWGSAKSGYILNYQRPEDRTLQYLLNSDYTQEMEIMGQNIDLVSNSSSKFHIDSKGTDKDNFNLEVTIDTMSMIIKSPQGEIKPDLNPVIGASFDYVVSSKGMELDYSGAEAVKYIVAGEEEASIASSFQALFPDLPDQPIRIGDTWVSTDSVVEKGNSGKLEIIGNNTNTLVGMEKINGYDCIKINSDMKGTMSGSGSMQGLNTTTSGTIESTDTWYFAYKEGVFVKLVSEGVAESTTKTTGKKELSIPSKRSYAISKEIIR